MTKPIEQQRGLSNGRFFRREDRQSEDTKPLLVERTNDGWGLAVEQAPLPHR